MQAKVTEICCEDIDKQRERILFVYMTEGGRQPEIPKRVQITNAPDLPGVKVLPPAGKKEMIESASKDELIGEEYFPANPRLHKNKQLKERMKVAKELNMNRIEEAGKATYEGNTDPYAKIVGSPHTKDDLESDDFIR